MAVLVAAVVGEVGRSLSVARDQQTRRKPRRLIGQHRRRVRKQR